MCSNNSLSVAIKARTCIDMKYWLTILISFRYFLLVSCQGFVEGNKLHCFHEDAESSSYTSFSTISPYTNIKQFDQLNNTCRPIQTWMMIRHGTKNPSKRDIPAMKNIVQIKERIIKNYESKHTQSGLLCTKDYLALKEWQWNEAAELKADDLNEQGFKEMFLLASRYKIRFPGLFQKDNDADAVDFKFTPTQRTEESYKSFAVGLYGKVSSETNIDVEDSFCNEVLKPYNECKKWKASGYINKEGQKQLIKLWNTPQFSAMITNISKRLGFDNNLTSADIDIMFANCCYDKTRNLHLSSPWCNVFTKYEMILMEYHYDLDWYYKFGYGNKCSQRLGYKPVNHMMQVFQKTMDESTPEHKAVILFSHDMNLGMMLTVFGQAKDDKDLKGDITYDEDALYNRKYMLSSNVPFSANIVAVLYECDVQSEGERYGVWFLLNEKSMEIEGCNMGFCQWSQLKHFLSSLKNINHKCCN